MTRCTLNYTRRNARSRANRISCLRRKDRWNRNSWMKLVQTPSRAPLIIRLFHENSRGFPRGTKAEETHAWEASKTRFNYWGNIAERIRWIWNKRESTANTVWFYKMWVKYGVLVLFMGYFSRWCTIFVVEIENINTNTKVYENWNLIIWYFCKLTFVYINIYIYISWIY